MRHRDLRFDLPHGAGGTVPQVANPIRYSRTAIEYRVPPPRLGEHTREVLEKDLGLDAARVADLASRGVV